MNNVIYVTGGIVAESGHHVAKNWVCLADESYKNEAIQVIDGDLILNEESKTIPYCTYAAHKGITCTNGNIEWLADPILIFQRYNKEIERLEILSNIDVEEVLKQVHLKCLNAGVFAELEYFLIEAPSSLILSDKLYFENYISRKKINIESCNLFQEVYESIHRIVGHRFDKISPLYEILGIDLPDTTDINEQIKNRHDIIHRSGKKVMGNHLETLSFTKEGLDKLIDVCNNFVMCVWDEFMRKGLVNISR